MSVTNSPVSVPSSLRPDAVDEVEVFPPYHPVVARLFGSGNTLTLVYTLLWLVFGKFRGDEKKRPGPLFLDLKGDNAKEVYELARRFGRKHEILELGVVAMTVLSENPKTPTYEEYRQLFADHLTKVYRFDAFRRERALLDLDRGEIELPRSLPFVRGGTSA